MIIKFLKKILFFNADINKLIKLFGSPRLILVIVLGIVNAREKSIFVAPGKKIIASATLWPIFIGWTKLDTNCSYLHVYDLLRFRRNCHTITCRN